MKTVICRPVLAHTLRL